MLHQKRISWLTEVTIKLINQKRKIKAEEEMKERKMGQWGRVTKRKGEVGGKEKENIYFITFKICLLSTYSLRST